VAFKIGTSGFIYDHWRGRFYPPSARGTELEFYAERFDTVELNVTFYRMPASATFRAWARRVPDDFVFAVKASRYLTHVRRLQEPREPVEFLLERATELGPHLGPILLQLPPDLAVDLDALAATLSMFPPFIRVAVEPRHPSWFIDDLRRLLTEHGAALCLADRRGPISPIWTTTDWSYLRFHGGRALPPSCYSADALSRWASIIADDGPNDRLGFAYFNNDHNGCALRDAATLGRDLGARGVTLERRPEIDPSVVEGTTFRSPAGMSGRQAKVGRQSD
jgi:uncharacterized protein YecE (DUF72 family)